MPGIFKLFLCLFHVTFYSFKSMMSGIFKLLLCLFHVTFYSLFRRFCIYITGEHFSLSLSACCTWYFSGFLVFMLCAFLFSGNIWAVFGFFIHFLAKFKQSFSRLSSSLSIPSLTNMLLTGRATIEIPVRDKIELL